MNVDVYNKVPFSSNIRLGFKIDLCHMFVKLNYFVLLIAQCKCKLWVLGVVTNLRSIKKTDIFTLRIEPSFVQKYFRIMKVH